MSAYGYIDTAIAGLPFGNVMDIKTATRSCQELLGIGFGAPVFGYVGDNKNAYKFYLDTNKIVFDGDFVAENSIVITVNGVAASAVVFADDHDVTAAAVVVAVNALDGVECVLDTTDANNRTFLIRTKGATCVATEAITGGGGQVTGTVTTGSGQVFIGAAGFVQKLTAVGYEKYDAMNVIVRGQLWVPVLAAVYSENIAYVDNAGAGIGTFTNATGSVAINGVYNSNASASGLAILQINGQTAMTYAAVFN